MRYRQTIKILTLFVFALGITACNITGNSINNKIAFSQQSSANNSDLWHRIAGNLNLKNYCQRTEVQSQINWYVRHPSSLRLISEHARPYLYYVYTQVHKKHLPAVLSLLPVKESGYDPFAYSGVGAAGLWQLMPGTASGFGVKQDWWYDGRRDIFASTKAALDYLTYLNSFFKGDWLLAIAAYDSGEGTVESAIQRNIKLNKPTDYWSLDLPQETQVYIPRLLAFACIVRNQESYPIHIPSIPNRAYLAAVHLDSQIDLAHAAKLAGISLHEIYELNPGYNRWATDPNGPHQLVLPIDKIDQFKKNLKQVSKKKLVSWRRHTIEAGDTLGKIANQYKTSVRLLKQVNRLKSDFINAGKILLVPFDATHLTYYVKRAAAHYLHDTKHIPGPQRVMHTVRHHEMLWTISREYHVSVRQIRFWNNFRRSHTLEPGERLILWLPVPSNRARVTASKRYYQVKPGDSLWKIAKQFHVSIPAIRRWNHLSRHALLRSGQRLKIYSAWG